MVTGGDNFWELFVLPLLDIDEVRIQGFIGNVVSQVVVSRCVMLSHVASQVAQLKSHGITTYCVVVM